ncbi:MAG: hypothetical protein MK077_08560 [Phycisphaerales bacterium]|jgi:hypothetical protein|nr:hypothetical protein [Phycisphaerales bacterium]
MKPMNRETYLSMMLTVVAVLLTVDLGVRLAADPPSVVASAQAQTVPKAPQRGAGSAAALANEQRRAMISLLEQLTTEVKGLRSELKKGSIKVSVKEPVKR